MMHNGRMLKEGTPEEIESDPEVQEIYLGGRPCLSRPPRRCSSIRDLHVYYGEFARDPGRRPHARRAHPGDRRPQRHGQVDALQHDRRAEAGAQRLDPLFRPRHLAARSAPDRAPRRRLRAAGPARLAQPFGRRAPAPRGPRGAMRHGPSTASTTRSRRLPRAGKRRGAAFRRRAADAGDLARAALGNPKLLVMDEPTEGLAPVIVEQVEAMLVSLAAEGDIAVLVIEQNIGVATAVAETVAIMVNGRINRSCHPPSLPPTATCSSGCSASAGTARPRRSAGRRRDHDRAPRRGSVPCRARRRTAGSSRNAERRADLPHRHLASEPLVAAAGEPRPRRPHRHRSPSAERHDRRRPGDLRHSAGRAARAHGVGGRHLRYQGRAS